MDSLFNRVDSGDRYRVFIGDYAPRCPAANADVFISRTAAADLCPICFGDDMRTDCPDFDVQRFDPARKNYSHALIHVPKPPRSALNPLSPPRR